MALGPFQEHLHLGEQFLEMDGLYQIVVRTELESVQLAVHVAECREDDDRCVPVAAADLLGQLEAIHFRQAQVQQHQMEPAVADGTLGHFAVEYRKGGIPRLLQLPAQRAG